MAARANSVKLGLFVILAFGAVLAVAIVIGVQRANRETVSYVTYFDEAVTGLDVGAPVRARGVLIGQVGHITFAPDHRMVEVRSDLDVESLVRLGLRTPEWRHTPAPLPPDLRAQLGTQGLTGLRYIALDLFDPKTNPPPTLPFAPPELYIPAARSMQKNIEETISNAMDGLSRVIDTLIREETAERVSHTTAEVDEVMGRLDTILRSVDQEQFPKRAGLVLDELRVASVKLNKVLDRVDGEAGLLATTQSSVSSVGEAGRSASQTTRDLGAMMGEFRATAEAIRLLADRLEREPDMLLKGRARGSAR